MGCSDLHHQKQRSRDDMYRMHFNIGSRLYSCGWPCAWGRIPVSEQPPKAIVDNLNREITAGMQGGL